MTGDSLLETMLAIDGTVLRLADHVARLARSAAELGVLLPDDLVDRVATAVPSGTGRWVVRLVVSRQTEQRQPASVAISAASAPTAPPVRGVSFARRSQRIWRHKWADRSELAEIEAEVEATYPGSLPLLLDAQGDVAELSRGSFFLLGGRRLVTPPLSNEVLPGVTRQAVLDCAAELGLEVQIRRIAAMELQAPEVTMFWTSAVSGVVLIESLDGAPLRLRDGAARSVAMLRQKLGFL